MEATLNSVSHNCVYILLVEQLLLLWRVLLLVATKSNITPIKLRNDSNNNAKLSFFYLTCLVQVVDEERA